MPRPSKRPVVFLALSPASVANALGIEPRKVYAAVDAGDLPVFMNGANRRCLVSHVERWVLSWPKAPKRKRRNVSHAR
jgi:hypothetical protein